MDEIIKRMREQRDRLVAQARALVELSVTEARDLTGEESGTVERMLGEVDAIDKRMKELIDGEQRQRDIDAAMRNLGRDEQREARPSEFTAWARAAQPGESFEMRAMTTGGTGPNAVYSRLWEVAVDSSQILGAGVTFIDTTDGNTIPLPIVTAHANASATAAANAPLTASDSAIGTVDLGAVKRQFYTAVPNELISDATFDVEAYITRNAGRALGNAVGAVAEAALIAGATTSGATAPTASIGAATGSVFADALISLFYSLPGTYRTASSWLGSDAALAAVSKAKAGDGSYAFPGLLAGNMSIFQRPIYSGVALPAPTGTNKPLYIGDFSALAVRRAGGLRFERSTDAGFTTDQTVFRAIVRTAAVVVDVNAFRLLALTAS